MHVCKTSQNVIPLFQVKKHKTSKTGPAPLILKAVEKGWLWGLYNATVANGIKTKRIFCTTGGGAIKDLAKRMQEQWKAAGLTSKVSFNLTRSSATTKVRFTKQTLSADTF